MRLYPAYKLADVMNEHAVTFFALLNEGYRSKYADYQILAAISDLPHVSKEDREKFYKNLSWGATPPGDILKPSGTGSSPAEIKKILGG